MKNSKPLYIHTEDVHNTKAAEVVVPIVLELLSVNSVLDIGCGIGTWLKVFKECGIKDLLGVDGDYVNRTQLQIDQNNFLSHDLTQTLSLEKDFDLVVSLEVAEHLPEEAADLFVESIVKHGKAILFSAAIPGQGGQNHLNEQWPSYWQAKFLKHGYRYYDPIRPLIWNNKDVEVWYRQNMFLLLHESVENSFVPFSGVNLIHPDFWLEVENLRNQLNFWNNGDVGVANSWRSFNAALIKKIKKIFNK